VSGRGQPAARRLALLTNFIPPYRASLYAALAAHAGRLRIFVSTAMEPNRQWPSGWEGLDVTRQRSLSRHSLESHPYGFSDANYIHIPYDTLPLLLRYRPDVVISGELGLRTLQATVYRLVVRRSRIIVWATLSEHSEQARGWKRMLLRRWILRRADAVLVNGESGARYIKQFAVAPERIFFAPYTTDMAPFAAAPAGRGPREAHRLLYAGQLVERKGLLPFLGVLAQWAADHSERTVEFWLAGDGAERTALQAVDLPENLALRFMGNLAYGDLPQAYAEAGIFVLPTLADEWGVVVNEALASGLPVLGSTYSQAVEELVQDGLTGWTFRTDHPSEIYEALDSALTAPAEALDDMRKRAREAVQDLTPESVAERIAQAIRYVAAH
jgi:glycosyltransferase involved in cell wall biosynthesis